MSAPPRNPLQYNGLDAPSVQAEPCVAWYEAYGKVVYKYFRFQLVSPDDAEDFTAETFLRAVRAADRYDASRAGVQTWLIAIARNVLIDETWTHPLVARWMYESGQSDAAGIAA